MGKRKPTVPRRRHGAHFVDLTIRGSSARRVDAVDGSSVAAATASMTAPSGPCPLAPAADGSYPPPVSLSLPTALAATTMPADATPSDATSSLANMHIQQGGMPPSLHALGKPTVSTVPLVRHASSHHDDEETVTMTVAELEAWKQHTIMQIEDHFTNEQLKRIAEFGRVHANLVKEAKEYVAGIEAQLKEQFERERESLKQQAEAYVAQFQQENEQLRQRVQELEDELDLAQDGEPETEDAGVEDPSTVANTAPLEGPTPPLVDKSASGTDSGSTSLTSYSPESNMDEPPSENAMRVDAVAETMSRKMGIQTPRMEVLSIESPREALHLSESPVTTNDTSSPVDASDLASRDPLTHLGKRPSEAHSEAEDYL